MDAAKTRGGEKASRETDSRRHKNPFHNLKGKETLMEITAEREQAIRERFDYNHFPRLLGIEIDSITDTSARLSVEITENLLQLAGVMHGGAIATLVDTAVAMAILGACEAHAKFTTVELKVNYLRPLKEGRAVAEARLVQNGRRIIVADCDVFDAQGKLAAKGLLTYIRLDT